MWAAEGLDSAGLTPEAAARFLAARRAAGYVLYLSPKVLVPLLGFLRRTGAGPAEEMLERYRRYLVTERGLAAETAADYVAKVSPFLFARMGPGLPGLTAAEVTAFMWRPARRCGRARRS